MPEPDERHFVRVGRASTVFLIVLASVISLWLENAFQAFQILLQIGAGTGLLFLLRWFWWRINPWSELAAMVVSFAVAFYFQFAHQQLGFDPMHASLQLVVGVAITTVGWVTVTFMTAPSDRDTLQAFYDRIRPMGHGWRAVVDTTRASADGGATAALAGWFLGCVVVYAALFGTGYLIYGQPVAATVCAFLVGAGSLGLARVFPRISLS